jgi:hypothetical protein
MAYQLTATHHILRLEDRATIPPDPNNTDYQEYKAWVAQGNTAAPAAAPATLKALTMAEKLAAIGITIEELAAALTAAQANKPSGPPGQANKPSGPPGQAGRS